MSRPLRFWLSLGLSIQVVLSVLTVALVLLWALVPKLKTEASNQHQLLSQAAASQVGHYLGTNWEQKFPRNHHRHSLHWKQRL